MFLGLLIFLSVFHIRIKPMAQVERAARELFRSSPLTQIRPVQPKIKVIPPPAQLQLRLPLFVLCLYNWAHARI